MVSVTICSDFGAPQNKVCHCFHCFPIYLPWRDGTRCHDLKFSECWVLSQKHYLDLVIMFMLPWWFLGLPQWLSCKESTCNAGHVKTWVQSLGQEDPLKKWQPTSVLWPRKSHGQRSLKGYSPWGKKESDMTEQLNNSSLVTELQFYLRERGAIFPKRLHFPASFYN